MWKDTILQALDDRHLFQSDDHRSRFKELLDCYADASFDPTGRRIIEISLLAAATIDERVNEDRHS